MMTALSVPAHGERIASLNVGVSLPRAVGGGDVRKWFFFLQFKLFL